MALSCAASVARHDKTSRMPAAPVAQLRVLAIKNSFSSHRRGGYGVLGVGRHDRVEQERDPRDPWRDLLEQLRPLGAERALEVDEPGDVAARVRQARDEAAADRIGDDHEDDGDAARLLQYR